MLGTNIFIEIIQSHDQKMYAWDQSQAAIFNLGLGASTQSHVFTQSHVLRNACLGPVPSSHFQLGTSPMLSIIPTWDRSHVGILTSNYKLLYLDRRYMYNVYLNLNVFMFIVHANFHVLHRHCVLRYKVKHFLIYDDCITIFNQDERSCRQCIVYIYLNN